MTDDVTLARLEERVSGFRELMDERKHSQQAAIDVLATEMARRLSELNGEAGRLKEARAEAVSREMFDQFKDTQDKRVNEINTRIAFASGAAMVGGALVGILSRVLFK